MDHVNLFHEEVIITKRGKPVAKLIPYSKKPDKPLFGYMKNSVTINDDITEPLDVEWETNQF